MEPERILRLPDRKFRSILRPDLESTLHSRGGHGSLIEAIVWTSGTVLPLFLCSGSKVFSSTDSPSSVSRASERICNALNNNVELVPIYGNLKSVTEAN